MGNEAFKFLQEAVGKPEWVSTIEEGSGEEVVELAKENGYDCGIDDLKKVAAEIVEGKDDPDRVSEQGVKEATQSSAGFDEHGGYGSDSGFALMSGIAAALLKK